MIRSHPSDASLIACAAGTLPPPHAAVIAVHLAQCPECRAAMRLGEEIGGHLVAAGPATALGPKALETALGRLDEVPPTPPPPVPPTLAGLATGRWLWLGPGIRLMKLTPRDETDTRLDLIRIAPGVAVPTHGHGGFESTCVMQGGYADATGEYRTGDIAEGDAPMVHAPTALPGADCICLIATTGRLRPLSPVARLVERFIGI